MGDELGCLHRKPELRRSEGPPLRGTGHRHRMVERLLDLDGRELAHDLRLTAAEPARAGPDHAAPKDERNYKAGRGASRRRVKNQEISDRFNEIADMLDILGEDAFRIISYRRAARQLEALTEDVEDLVREGRVASIPGIGAALAEKIEEYVTTAKIGYHEELRAKFPPGLLDMLRVRGIGPKKVKLLWQELGITDIETLRKAAQTHRLSRVKGFGEKTEEKILRSIELLKEGESIFLLAHAHVVAAAVTDYLRKRAPVKELAAAGSLRRMRETVHDIDILATTDNPRAVAEAFTTMPGARKVLPAGRWKPCGPLKPR